MPHVTIECSANVAKVTDVAALTGALHEAALATGVAPLDALRTRTALHEHYAIGDRAAQNLFVAVTVRLAPGRSDQAKQLLLATLLDALDDRLGPARADAMLSVELQEIDPASRVNRNHLRAVIAERAAPRDKTAEL
jgi:5-carboxymethyl-2-hydroxymuconate isomerase